MDVATRAAELERQAKTIEKARLVEKDLAWWAKAIARRAAQGLTRCSDEERILYRNVLRADPEYMRILGEYLGPGFSVERGEGIFADGVSFHRFACVAVRWNT